MSFSFIFVDKKNELDINNINEYLRQNYLDYEILYCSTQNVQMQNLKNFVINENDDTEEIINSILYKVTKQNIVIVRKFISNETLKYVTDNIKSPDSIVYFKKRYKGVKRFFCNLLKKLAKFIYAHDIIFASHAIVAYGENPSAVLKELEYPSNAMRKFSWVGIKTEELDGGESYKLDYKKSSVVLKTILPIVLSVILLVIYVLYRTKIPIFWEIIMLLTILIGITLFVIYGTNWFIKSQIGENTNSKVDLK